ncbi:Helicase associated domain protein [Streptomyces sp. ISL-96]|uniref:DEAD/DEAH box helicase n=1 Tax=Streptomyces sp. ISL-96 TaxID=2819191 RepID=UPI001BEBD5DB|nr:DEAD/DEAH box helicase [Streptomyces sp. ISL-96]MBT2493433.1 Helicase associated domain protein [Streptomyces sp. ISL-96]
MATIRVKELRPHQREAFKAATRALKRLPRATVICATGAGKTLIAMRTAEHFAPSGSVLVVVPSLSLISQTAAHWDTDSTIRNMIGVCSLRHSQVGLSKKRITLTTDAPVLAKTMKARTEPFVVFATYSSLPAIALAHRRHGLPPWSLVIIDEAHRSSGSSNKQWATIHKDTAIPAQRRLYMTATPRTWAEPDPKKRKKPSAVQGPPEPLASMDDPTVYGPVVYQLGLADAIDRGILADYRIVVPVIDDDELRDVLQTKDLTEHLNGLRLAALQVGLLRAMAIHKLRRVVSFHSRIAYAQRFSRSLPDTVADTQRSTGIRRLWVHAIHSGQSARNRAWHLAEFEGVPLLRRTGHRAALDGAVLSNVRVLGEGVDVPDADAVLFADPKRSSSDIVQALGRALRQPPGAGKVATLIIPVYVGKRQTTEGAMKSSEFAVLWEVLNGLREHDTHIWRRLGGGKHLLERDAAPLPPSPERADEIVRVTGVRAHELDHDLWAAGWNAAIHYFERHQHLNVPGEHTDKTGYALGRWLAQQRSLYANGSLAADRAFALTTLNISWPHPPGSFEHYLDQAITCAGKSGTLALITAPDPADRPLVRWLRRQRDLADSGRLDRERIASLNAVDPWWNPPWEVDWQHTYAHVDRRLADGRTLHTPTPAADEDSATWLDRQITAVRDLHPKQARLLTQLAHRYPNLHPHAMLLMHNPAQRAQAFCRALTAARQFHQREGHFDVPLRHRENVRGNEVLLGQWIKKSRSDTAQMTTPQINALTALGIDLQPVFRAAPPEPADHDGAEDDDWWAPPSRLGTSRVQRGLSPSNSASNRASQPVIG